MGSRIVFLFTPSLSFLMFIMSKTLSMFKHNSAVALDFGYFDYKTLPTRALGGVVLLDISGHIKLHKFTDLIIPQFEVVIGEELEFTIVVFGWLLPLLEIEGNNLCEGLAEKLLTGEVVRHIILCEIDLQAAQCNPNVTKQYSRHNNCIVLSGDKICVEYSSFLMKTKKILQKVLKPSKPYAPLSKVSRECLIGTPPLSSSTPPPPTPLMGHLPTDHFTKCIVI